MQTSKHHRELNELGEGKCSVPMWGNGSPSGFCDKPAYGERPKSRISRAWWGDEIREDGRYNGYVPALACECHGGPGIRTYKDGNAWCAVKPDFVNLQESDAGFGNTPEAATKELLSL